MRERRRKKKRGKRYGRAVFSFMAWEVGEKMERVNEGIDYIWVRVH